MKGRQRGRNNGGKPRMHHQGGGGGGGRNPNFDQNAGRMRGNAQQLMDKFLALARDASQQGDRVLAENYFQHADHYYRVVNARFEGQPNNNQQQRRFNGPNQNDRGYDGQDGQDGQGNYQDYNSGPSMPPGPSQNLVPNPIQGDSNQQAVHQQAVHQQAVHQQAQPVHHQQAQPVHHQQAQPVHHQQAQPVHHQQAQPIHQQQPQPSYQPSAQPAPREPEGDIGLPPQLFGAEPASSESPPAPARGEAAAGRPRHSGRRRFTGRREGQQPAAEPTDAS